jgi:5-carboxymethyl-2-hydroxymuconate isomerase
LNLANPDELMRSVYATVESTGLFASNGVGGIKVRLHPYRYGHEHFVHVFVNIMEGRTPVQKEALSEKVVRALKALLPTVEIISMNIRDFEKATYCNATMIEVAMGLAETDSADGVPI